MNKTNARIRFLVFFSFSLSMVLQGANPVTSAFSETSPNYKRKLLPSGQFELETYAFGKGEVLDKSNKDESLNRMSFREIGNVLAEALLEADYTPTSSPEETDLLILVHWGKVMPFSDPNSNLSVDSIVNAFDALKLAAGVGGAAGEGDGEGYSSGAAASAESKSVGSSAAAQVDVALTLQQMADDDRRMVQWENAKLLGYHDAVTRAWNLAEHDHLFRDSNLDVVKDLECPRYFVILQAYDFQKWWKEKEQELLWTTRFSIRANRRSFDEELRSMALAASRVVGTNSKSLKRGLISSRVEMGDLEFLGVEGDTE